MSSKNVKSKLLSKFQEIKKGRNPRITPGIGAAVVLSGESGDPSHPTALNDTQERTKAAISIFKKIKKEEGSPTLILNGTDSQNKLMSKIAKKAGINKIVLVKNPPIPKTSTLSQFQGLKNLPFKKIAIVTHAYHGVRVQKYAEKYLPKNCQFLLFLLKRKGVSPKKINEEISKILKYSKKGDI